MPRPPQRPPVGDASDPRGFEVLIARYLDWMEVHHYSPFTLAAGRRILRHFASWCEERGVVRPWEVSRALLERYQRWLFHYRRDSGVPLALRTQLQRLVRIKRFFGWLARERYLLYDPASALDLPRRGVRLPVDVFSKEEVEQILATPKLTTPIGLRDRALLETFYSTGVRRSEMIALDLYDLDREHGWVAVRQGKGRKDRVVPIGERALAWVERYLADARPELVLYPDERALFVTHKGLRFTTDGMSTRVSELLLSSGVRRRRGCCHLFRHTCATLMLEGGADIRYIQEMLGHAELSTTEVYTRVSIQKLKDVHTACHPAARLARSDEQLRVELLASLEVEALAEGELDVEDAGELERAGDVDEVH